MKIRWPREREAAEQRQPQMEGHKSKEDFDDLIAIFAKRPSLVLIGSTSRISQGEKDVNAAVEAALNDGLRAGLTQTEDLGEMLLALSCAVVLMESPTLAAWENVRQLKSHSWQLEHWLSNAMLAYADVCLEAKSAYVDLAKNALFGLDGMRLHSQWERKNNERESALAAWNDCEGKLDEIWWGLRGYPDFQNYEEEYSLIYVLSKLDMEEYASCISKISNPFLVRASLFFVGVGGFFSEFDLWKKLIAAAPLAFEPDGKWNGSILAPLLLVNARYELLQTGRGIGGNYLSPGEMEIDGLRNEIVWFSDLVIEAISGRGDALPLFSRWSSWLMRQLLNQGERSINDPRTSGFVDNAIIEAIGKSLKGKAILASPPDEAPHWERWCFYCVHASHAHGGFIGPPSPNDFINEWNISADDWPAAKGSALVEHAKNFVMTRDEMPGIAAHLLAYPIAQNEAAAQLWAEMWQSAYALRAVVEFGDSDVIKDSYQSQSKASDLLVLLFKIGLAIFDQRVGRLIEEKSVTDRSLALLHQWLAEAVREMSEIDDTLGRDKWRISVRHLAVRRFIYGQVKESDDPGAKAAIFLEEDSPRLSDYLFEAKNDAFELLSILGSVAMNDPDIGELLAELSEAEVDVKSTLEMVRRLNQYNPRRYPINEQQLKMVQKLSLMG